MRITLATVTQDAGRVEVALDPGRGKERGIFEGLANFSPIFWGISQLIDASNTELLVASDQNQWRLLCTDTGGKPGSDTMPLRGAMP